MRYLLDTNSIIYILKGQLESPLIEGIYFVSVISEIELLSFPSLEEGEERAIKAFLAETNVVELSKEIRETAIVLRRKYRFKIPDSVIAGTAIVLEAELLTNDGELSKIQEIHARRLSLKKKD